MATKKRASKRAVKVKEPVEEATNVVTNAGVQMMEEVAAEIEAQSTPGHPVDTVVDIVDTGEPMTTVAIGGEAEPVEERGPVMTIEEFNERYAQKPVGTGPCSECDGLGIIEVGIGLSYSTCPKCRGAGTRHFQEDPDDGRAVAAPAEGEASGEGDESFVVGVNL